MTIVDPFLAGAGKRAAPVPPAMERWWLMLVIVGIVFAAGPAWAEPALRIGAHGGVELRDRADPFVGVDLRLSFPRSPLTINPTFDYVFDEKMTLYELSVNALFYLPVPIRRFNPYIGVGVNVTSFSYKEITAGVDDNGNRMGMNLAAGVCFDVPVVSPFLHIGKRIGELDFVSFGAGFVVALAGGDRWTGCGRRAQ
jgi:hypothetical protein